MPSVQQNGGAGATKKAQTAQPGTRSKKSVPQVSAACFYEYPDRWNLTWPCSTSTSK